MGMPFRSQRTLEAWLQEFREQGHAMAGSLKVMSQDGDGGADTGLVGVLLANASTVTYLEPQAPYATKWIVTMEPREEDLVIDADGLRALAAELSVVAALCDFLEAKSASFVGNDSP